MFKPRFVVFLGITMLVIAGWALIGDRGLSTMAANDNPTTGMLGAFPVTPSADAVMASRTTAVQSGLAQPTSVSPTSSESGLTAPAPTQRSLAAAIHNFEAAHAGSGQRPRANLSLDDAILAVQSEQGSKTAHTSALANPFAGK